MEFSRPAGEALRARIKMSAAGGLSQATRFAVERVCSAPARDLHSGTFFAAVHPRAQASFAAAGILFSLVPHGCGGCCDGDEDGGVCGRGRIFGGGGVGMYTVLRNFPLASKSHPKRARPTCWQAWHPLISG